MNTIQLTCFLAVAETLSFAKAAEKLSITQPAVTHQIRSLEEELNVKLFTRTTRRVELTQAGVMFINDAKSILNISEKAKKRFEEPVKTEQIMFSIGCHAYNELHFLSNVLRCMRQSYPSLYPAFHVVPLQHLFRLLAEENVDVVMAFQEKNAPKSCGKYKELAKISTVGIMAPDNPLSQKNVLTKKDLESERLIFLDPQKCPDSIIKFQSQLIGIKSVSDVYFCNSFDAAITLARAGFGIAIIPNFLFLLNDPTLVYIPLEDFEPMSYGAYYKSTKGNPVLKLFLQLSREIFAQQNEECPPSITVAESEAF